MTRVPQGGFNFSPNPNLLEAYIAMGETAENVAAQYGVSRADQELLAYSSQQKAAAAQAAGRLKDEIVGVMTPAGLVTSTAACARRPPWRAWRRPEARLPAGRQRHRRHVLAAHRRRRRDPGHLAGLRGPQRPGGPGPHPRGGRRRLSAEIMGMGPVPATRKALARAGLTIDDIDVVEINEAFGSQAVACVRELGIPWEKVNIDGGGIAIGHPLGATGARITAKGRPDHEARGQALRPLDSVHRRRPGCGHHPRSGLSP